MAGGGDGNQPYRGSVGQTRRERVQYTAADGAMVPVDACRSVNVATHPDLAAQLAQGTLNRVSLAGEVVDLHVSVLYHNPERELCVLVIAPTARHTEFVERRALLDALAADPSEPVPSYVRDFSVVFGADGLASYLESKADRELYERRIQDLEQQLAARTSELDKRTAELGRRTADLKRRDETLREREATLSQQRAELSRLEGRIEELTRALDKKGRTLERRITAVGEQAARSARAPDGDPEGTPLPAPVAHEDIETHPFELMSGRELERLGLDGSGKVRAAPAPDAKRRGSPQRDDTAVTRTAEVALERWIVARAPQLKWHAAGQVQFAVAAEHDVLEALLGTSRPATTSDTAVRPSGDLDVRIQLHRLPTYPVVVLSIGGTEVGGPRVDIDFNVADDRDRELLTALASNCSFQFDLFDNEYLLVRTRRLSPALEDNLRYVLAAADEHLNSIGPADRSLSRARAAWQKPGFDRYGLDDPRRERYESIDFDELTSLGAVARALSVTSELARPVNEAFLLLVVGEELPRWTERKRRVALRAVEVGLWPGAELARVAIAEGAARSPRDLVTRLRATFGEHASAGSDKPLEAVIDGNRRALERETRRLGLATEKTRTPSSGGGTDADLAGVTSGTIEDKSSAGPAPRRSLEDLPLADLAAHLSSREWRGRAGLEIARRGDARGLEPLFEALDQMTRSEAVQILGRTVAFGSAAAPYLLAGLRSRKGFVRHGCALALAVLRHGDGIEKICDLLLSEPTDVWREVARAVGHVGAPAVMSLIARLRNLDDDRRARVAWALANVAVRGARGPVETLAQGRDPDAAAVAIRALELEHDARKDDAQVHGRATVRDQTVNRAFSRKFFEAMNAPEERRNGPNSPNGDDRDDVLPLDDSDLIETDAEGRTTA